MTGRQPESRMRIGQVHSILCGRFEVFQQVTETLATEGQFTQALIQAAAQLLEKALFGGDDLFGQTLPGEGGQMVQNDTQQPPRSIAEKQEGWQAPPAAVAAGRTRLQSSLQLLPGLLGTAGLLLAAGAMSGGGLVAELDESPQGCFRRGHAPAGMFHQRKGSTAQPLVPFLGDLFRAGSQGAAEPAPSPLVQAAAIAGFEHLLRHPRPYQFAHPRNGLPSPVG